jgi:hypothetical protein
MYMQVDTHMDIHKSTKTDKCVCIQYWTSYPESLWPEVGNNMLLLSVSAPLLYILEVPGLILVSDDLYFEA